MFFHRIDAYRGPHKNAVKKIWLYGVKEKLMLPLFGLVQKQASLADAEFYTNARTNFCLAIQANF